MSCTQTSRNGTIDAALAFVGLGIPLDARAHVLAAALRGAPIDRPNARVRNRIYTIVGDDIHPVRGLQPGTPRSTVTLPYPARPTRCGRTCRRWPLQAVAALRAGASREQARPGRRRLRVPHEGRDRSSEAPRHFDDLELSRARPRSVRVATLSSRSRWSPASSAVACANLGSLLLLAPLAREFAIRRPARARGGSSAVADRDLLRPDGAAWACSGELSIQA